MASERREEVRVVRDEGMERRQQVVEYKPSTQHVLVARISQLIWFVVAVVAILLTLRFVLYLIAANPASGFAAFIYNITNVLVAPFAGLVALPTMGNGSIVDVISLIALVVYTLLGWGIVQLFRIIFSDTGGMRRVKTVKRSG